MDNNENIPENENWIAQPIMNQIQRWTIEYEIKYSINYIEISQWWMMDPSIKLSSHEHVHTNSDEQNGDESEENECVNEYGDAACLEVAKFNEAVLAGDLKEEAWR